MATNDRPETLVEKRVTYSLELNGKFFLVENVPARVNEETGEQFFSPSTVAYLQQITIDGKQPDRHFFTAITNANPKSSSQLINCGIASWSG